MARVVSEKIWTSEKVRNITPNEWQPEYAWLLPIAKADGTFECQPRLVWATAYACSRDESWTPEKVGHLLDELARVDLLQRATDEAGKVWGRWVGSEKFNPSPERCKTHRYKTGRADLFSAVAPPAQRPLGVGVVSGCGEGEGEGEGVSSVPPKNPENEPQVKSPVVSEASSSLSTTVAPTPNQEQPDPTEFASRIDYSAACHKAGVLPKPRRVLRGSLSKEEYSKLREEEQLVKNMLDNFGVVPDGNGGWKKPEAK